MRKVWLIAFLAGCYETPKPACAFLCGAGSACPDGYACSTADNRCHLMESGGTLASCPDQLIDAARTIDSAVAVDAAHPDAMPIDATPLDAAPPDAVASCSPALSAHITITLLLRGSSARFGTDWFSHAGASATFTRDHVLP